jgi:hypothetical protein
MSSSRKPRALAIPRQFRITKPPQDAMLFFASDAQRIG